MNDEFSDEPSYCQAWAACAQYYHQSSAIPDRHLSGGAVFQIPAEGESRGYADDATWILTSSFVIFTMQSGFGLLEAGSCSPGWEVNIMMKNIVDVIFTGLTYYLVGYGISFGEPSTPFMGKGAFPADGGYDIVQSGFLYSKYIFQLSFAATSTTIVSGCVAMRLKFFIYVLYSLIAVVFYAFVAHWIFADGGFLKEMGVQDFAGGCPVHIFGGVNGLVATLFLGPRMGRFDGTRPISDFFPSSPTSQCFGLLALWWGWIGFNCGSSFGITDDKWVVAIRCAITTINSTVGGGIASIAYTLCRTRGQMVIPEHLINGILGSLVAITPACATVSTYNSFPIGIIGAVVALSTNTLACHRKIDDPVGVIGVHLAAGIWGVFSVGFFADSKLPGISNDLDGIFYGGTGKLLRLQSLAIVCTIGWALMFSTGFFYLVGIAFSRDWRDPRKGLRVDAEEEKRGADWTLHGVIDEQAYCDEMDEKDDSSNGDGASASDSLDDDLRRKTKMYARSMLVGHFDDLVGNNKQGEHAVDSELGVDDSDVSKELEIEWKDNSPRNASTPVIEVPQSERGAMESLSNRSFQPRRNTGVLGKSQISGSNIRSSSFRSFTAPSSVQQPQERAELMSPERANRPPSSRKALMLASKSGQRKLMIYR